MIGLEKEPINRSVQRKKVVFNRFAAADTTADGAAALGSTGGGNAGSYSVGTLCAKTSGNCDFSGNVLKQGVGAELFYTTAGNSVVNLDPNTVKRVFCVRLRSGDPDSVFERYLAVRDDGYVWLYEEESAGFVMGIPVGGNARGALLRSADGEERFLIVGESGARFFMADEVFYPTENSDLTNVFCVCKNRLFILLKDGRLAYSDPMTPWDLSESIDDGGYIELPLALGTPIEMTAVDEYVYVFFERAIMRLTVKGGGRDFCLEEVPYRGAKIAGGSVCALQGGVIFLAGDGLWTAQGTKAQRFCEGLTLYVGAQDAGAECSAAVCKGKYFLRYPNVDGGFSSVAVDTDGESWSDCYDLPGLSEGFDAPLFIKAKKLYRLGESILPVGEKCLFQSVDTDFGVRGKKTLRRLELVGKGSLVLNTYCDGRCFSCRVSLADGRAFVDLDVRGESFSFSFEIGYRSYLRSMSAEIET